MVDVTGTFTDIKIRLLAGASFPVGRCNVTFVHYTLIAKQMMYPCGM